MTDWLTDWIKFEIWKKNSMMFSENNEVSSNDSPWQSLSLCSNNTAEVCSLSHPLFRWQRTSLGSQRGLRCLWCNFHLNKQQMRCLYMNYLLHEVVSKHSTEWKSNVSVLYTILKVGIMSLIVFKRNRNIRCLTTTFIWCFNISLLWNWQFSHYFKPVLVGFIVFCC